MLDARRDQFNLVTYAQIGRYPQAVPLLWVDRPLAIDNAKFERWLSIKDLLDLLARRKLRGYQFLLGPIDVRVGNPRSMNVLSFRLL
jgi:hypothetical protein